MLYHAKIMRLKSILISVLAVAVIGGLGAVWLAPDRSTLAPDITITTLQGEQLGLAGLRGRPVLVNFWATTCSSCTQEMPQLVNLYEELAPRGFEIIGISMAYDPPNHVLAFKQTRGIPYPLALDIQSLAARAFGDVQLTPSSFLIAPDGRIVHRQTGTLDMPELRGLILGMLANN